MSSESGYTGSESPKIMLNEAEFDEFVNRPDGSPANTMDNVAEHYARLSLLPDMFKPDMGVAELASYAEKAAERWQSLFGGLVVKYGEDIIPADTNKVSWIIEELERYARYGEVQAVSAAMLIKYLEGTQPNGIKRILGYKLGNDYAEMPMIRQRFINSIGKEPGGIKTPDILSQRNIGVVSVATATAVSESNDEPTFEIKHGTTTERLRIAKSLTQYLGGNRGAYQEMLSLTADVIVSDDHRTSARVLLFKAIAEMVKPSVSNKLPSYLKLDIATEAGWLVMLCGKELVEEEGNWYSKNSRTYTLQGIRDFVFRERIGRRLSLSPDQVEAKALTALGKVIEYKKLTKLS